MPRTTAALRSRRSRVRGFFVRRLLAASLIAAGAVLVGLAAFHRIDGVLAQRDAREVESVESSDTVTPPDVVVEGPEDESTPLVEMDVLGETEIPSVPLVDTAELRDLPPVSAVEGVAQAQLQPPPVPDSLTPLRVMIPRLGMDLAVFEGVSEKALRRGPGHLPGTPCPGLSSAQGNCVLTGHRDSFFRPLANAREGDLVVLRAGERSQRYRLARMIVVRPEQTEVASPTGEARLTLLTCYPFRWIGPAPLRLAWEADPEVTTAARVSR
jgi:LPXTG-site transpeptidase (sortase) family protein